MVGGVDRPPALGFVNGALPHLQFHCCVVTHRLTYLLVAHLLAFHERVVKDLRHTKTIACLGLEHAVDERLQFVGEVAIVTALTDLSPVDFWLANETLVEEVRPDVSFVERRKANHHGKE